MSKKRKTDKVAKETAEDSPGQEQDNVEFPVIFQCKKCYSIIGDTIHLVDMNGDQQMIALSNCTSVSVGSKTHTSSLGFDKLCSFYYVNCKQCKSCLGKVYLTTSEKLDHLRNCFALNTHEIISYQLGSSGIVFRNGAATDLNNKKGRKAVLSEVSVTKRIAANEEQLSRIKYLIVSLNERMEEIESHMSAESDDNQSVGK